MRDASQHSVSNRGPQWTMKALLLKKIKQKDDCVSLQLNTERCCIKSHSAYCLWVKHKNKIAVKTSLFNYSTNGFIKMMTAHKQMWEMYYGRTGRLLSPLQPWWAGRSTTRRQLEIYSGLGQRNCFKTRTAVCSGGVRSASWDLF